MIAALMLIMPLNVHAATKETEAEINKAISELSTGFKNIITLQLEEKTEELKSKIIVNDWDYGYTMESINTDAMKDADYVEMLAAYMTAKKYKDDIKDFTYLGFMDLIRSDIQVDEAEVAIPVSIETFKPFEDAYIKDGIRYITKPETILTYKEIEGLFYPDMETLVEPDVKKIRFARTTYSLLSADEILEYYGLDKNEEAKAYYEELKDLIKKFTSSESLSQSMYAFISGDGTLYTIDTSSLGYSDLRTAVINNALYLTGKVPYQWGGKPEKAGYDTSWGTFEDNGEQKGLDCSGFIEWVYMTTGFDDCEKLESTYSMLDSADIPQIPSSDIQAGDIGVMLGDVNHAGIYLGNIDGKDLWIHMNKAAGTVSVGEFNNFMIFYSPISLYENGDKTIDNINDLGYYTNIGNTEQIYSDEDVYLLAQLIVHEAGGEGLNGWIAVAEVVRNRIKSEEYPNTIPEVALQPWQFSYFYEDNGIIPPENIIKVARNTIEGQLSILCNEDVLYYKNPVIVDGIEPTEQIPWGEHPWFTAIGRHAFYLK